MSKALGYFQETALGGVKPLPGLSTARGTSQQSRFISGALIQAEAQDIRWRDDGTDPTTTVGNLIKANTTLEFQGDLDKFRMIGAVGGAIANVSYYGS